MISSRVMYPWVLYDTALRGILFKPTKSLTDF